MGYGQTLKKILKEKNMTVTELARLCGLKASTFYTCINRDTSIRYDMALPIANTLDIDVNLICKDNPYRGEEDFPPLLWEAGGLFTNMNKKKYFENQIYPVLELYDYNEYPQIYRLLANFFVLSDKGREQMGKSDVVINVMMFGGRRAGKTSVLAAMQSCFEDQFGNSSLMITPSDPETIFTIEEKQREIESYFGKNKRSFVTDDEPTMELNEYAFDVKLKSNDNSAMTIKFIDYPGEWLGDQNKIDLLNKYMEKSDIIMIAIDTPYLMEETPTAEDESIGQYNDYRNYSKRIGFMLKNMNLGGHPRMILFVPLKCEKYKNNGTLPIVATKIKEAYKPVFNIFEGKDASKAEIAILPIITIGKAEFAKFERDEEGEILIDEKWGTPSKAIFYFPDATAGKPEPLYCEQPVIYVLCYLLDRAAKEKKKKRDKLNPVGKWLMDNVWDKIWQIPSINDFLKEEDSLRRKMKTKDDGFEIVKNPLKF